MATMGVNLKQQLMGALNFNDTLIALGCRELAVEFIATFDSDFDSVAWSAKYS